VFPKLFKFAYQKSLKKFSAVYKILKDQETTRQAIITSITITKSLSLAIGKYDKF
jgi:hypothetical protein